MSLPPCAQDSVPGEVACLLPGRELHPLEAPGFAWRTEAFRNIQFERMLRAKPDGGKDGSDGIVAGPSWAKAIGVR